MVNSALVIYNSSIRRDYNDVENTRLLLTSVLHEHVIDSCCIPNIELSVYETLVNIIEHSSSQYLDHMITIECNITEEHVRIDIFYFGDRFDLTAADLPDIEKHYREGKRRGLGIFFIRKLVDKVEYSYNERINCTTLIKEIKPHAY